MRPSSVSSPARRATSASSTGANVAVVASLSTDNAERFYGHYLLEALPRVDLLERAGVAVDQLDLVELNEAFASQSLVVIRELGLDPERVNVNGGAIALGHPLGMSGARLALTATEELQRTSGKRALATMCIGVGQGTALALERV